MRSGIQTKRPACPTRVQWRGGTEETSPRQAQQVHLLIVFGTYKIVPLSTVYLYNLCIRLCRGLWSIRDWKIIYDPPTLTRSRTIRPSFSSIRYEFSKCIEGVDLQRLQEAVLWLKGTLRPYAFRSHFLHIMFWWLYFCILISFLFKCFSSLKQKRNSIAIALRITICVALWIVPSIIVIMVRIANMRLIFSSITYELFIVRPLVRKTSSSLITWICLQRSSLSMWIHNRMRRKRRSQRQRPPLLLPKQHPRRKLLLSSQTKMNGLHPVRHSTKRIWIVL